MSDDRFLSRWSRLKTQAKVPAPNAEPAPPPPVAQPGASDAEAAAPPPLPPVESLTPESDFSPFMGADVDPGLRRDALKKLFADPQFNVMDGLDVYIDDYSKPDPLPEGWLEKMNQVARLGAFVEKAKEPAEARESGPVAIEKQVAGAPEALPASNTSSDGSTSAEMAELHLREGEKPQGSGVDFSENRHDDA